MSTTKMPEIGSWYVNEDGDRFEIVAVDEPEDTIEIQYFSGDVEELDGDTWRALTVALIAAPEDWSGPFDDLVQDDFGDTERPYHPEDWNGPLDTIESEVSIDWEAED
jgi:hypothetical protein